jgi:hypothetical protein
MKFFLLIIAGIIIISCGYKKQSRQALQKEDSVRVPDSVLVAKRKIDSVRLAKQKIVYDSIKAIVDKEQLKLSRVAFGEAKFGMSVKEVIKTDIFKGGQYGKDYASAPSSKMKLGTEIYNKIEAYFYNDSLASVIIESWYYPASEIDNRLEYSASNLKDIIEEKYGRPNPYLNNIKEIDFTPGDFLRMYGWEIADKRIDIGMEEIEDGGSYIVKCKIYNVQYAEKRDKKLRSQEKQERDQMIQEYKQEKRKAASNF